MPSGPAEVARRARLDAARRFGIWRQAMSPTRKAPPESKADKTDRAARLKAALKANIARRKAQAKARAAADPTDEKD